MRQAFETHWPTFAHKQLKLVRQAIRTTKQLRRWALEIQGPTSLQKGSYVYQKEGWSGKVIRELAFSCTLVPLTQGTIKAQIQEVLGQ